MYPEQLRPSPESQAEYTAEWLEMADEVGAERFSAALVNAVRESESFPVIAKIRKACGLGTVQQSAAGADAAWLFVQDHMRQFGTEPYHVPFGQRRPALPPRIAYAVRLVGGLQRIADVSDDSLPFMRKDFAAAWERYEESAAAYNTLQLTAQVPKQLMAMPEIIPPKEPLVNVEQALANVLRMPRKYVRDMTDEEFEDRKEMLAQQKRKLLEGK